ncbi:hypothetical protein ODS41_00255 [Pyrobaculum sp. 3827-6]|uniref:aldehyde ferredoxin oxidoreductase N-terminal domain-containing protein n=1 Tax=Pyrobaculum sp. 3827-6 TaxID=2983604 RepID=UPI0021D7E033|nr:aldehyde ferredoxin oxidoreductase N-terminal domain-containing protein [Pyrobaculum sp. 3827-6]MCU7786365.1 hypothetical protein [Pyrobaculum sp. 3827-6]
MSGDNPLIFAAGPLTGTGVPMSGRAAAVFRSPLTGILGASNLGGKLGPVMRFAGVDVLVVLGRAERPTYLVVQEGRVESRDASHLWGMDAIETEEVLLREHGRNTPFLLSGRPGGHGAPGRRRLPGRGRARRIAGPLGGFCPRWGLPRLRPVL